MKIPKEVQKSCLEEQILPLQKQITIAKYEKRWLDRLKLTANEQDLAQYDKQATDVNKAIGVLETRLEVLEDEIKDVS